MTNEQKIALRKALAVQEFMNIPLAEQNNSYAKSISGLTDAATYSYGELIVEDALALSRIASRLQRTNLVSGQKLYPVVPVGTGDLVAKDATPSEVTVKLESVELEMCRMPALMKLTRETDEDTFLNMEEIAYDAMVQKLAENLDYTLLYAEDATEGLSGLLENAVDGGSLTRPNISYADIVKNANLLHQPLIAGPVMVAAGGDVLLYLVGDTGMQSALSISSAKRELGEEPTRRDIGVSLASSTALGLGQPASAALICINDWVLGTGKLSFSKQFDIEKDADVMVLSFQYSLGKIYPNTDKSVIKLS